jgi:hypothetical protein
MAYNRYSHDLLPHPSCRDPIKPGRLARNAGEYLLPEDHVRSAGQLS